MFHLNKLLRNKIVNHYHYIVLLFTYYLFIINNYN